MSHPILKITMVQMSQHVGDLSVNIQTMLDAIQTAKSSQVDLIVFPELALTGYTPEDILNRSSFAAKVHQGLEKIAEAAQGIEVLFGAPHYLQSTSCYNAVFHCKEGAIAQVIHKRVLPNHGVFDEKRYFLAGYEAASMQVKGYHIGILICEDGWHAGPVAATMAMKPDFVIQVNASPFEANKQMRRYELVREIAQTYTVPLLVLNTVGSQDEVIFDGGSFVMDQAGELVQQAPFFESGLLAQTLSRSSDGLRLESGPLFPLPTTESQIYQALSLGVRSYMQATGFKHCLLGLSGGIDSALTLAIVADAIGASNVTAVMMPSAYTSKMSTEDARAQAQILGAHYLEMPIDSIVQELQKTLEKTIDLPLNDIAHQNLQARARGVLLMGLSNQFNALVLTTGNKSELAVGYATLYGDMAGGYDLLKDVYKTQVYALALYRNSISLVIPLRVLTRAPSAELKPNQTDQDTLPAYEMLDAILEGVVEHHLDEEELVNKGFERAVVQFVIQKVWQSEYKRRQGALGPKVSSCSFGKDWRIPIMK